MRGTEELEARRRRGRTEPFEVSRVDPSADGLPARFAIKGRSGRAYIVTVRSPGPPFNHCTCPDFATNGLGTCKHVEAALHHLEQEAPDALKALEEAGEKALGNLVYVDFVENGPTVRMHVGTKEPKTVSFAEKNFGKKGVLTEKKMKTAFDELEREGPALSIEVSPEATAFVAETLDRLDLDRKCQQLADALLSKGAPEGMALKPYQVEGAAFLTRNRKAMLLDDTGLDKPLQALSAVRTLRDAEAARTVLVLCHESRLSLWRRLFPEATEIPVKPKDDAGENTAKTTGDEPAEQAEPAEGAKPGEPAEGAKQAEPAAGAKPAEPAEPAEQAEPAEPAEQAEPPEPAEQAEPPEPAEQAGPAARVLSYNKVYQHVDELNAYAPSIVVLDQVHRIRNWQGRTGQTIKGFHAPYVFALGSPVLFSRAVQFFYLAQLLDPYLVGPAWRFFDSHLVRDGRGAVTDHKDMETAVDRVDSIILRRTREQVESELPKVIPVVLHLEPTSAQRKLMVRVLRSLILKFEADRQWEPVDRAEVVAHLARLRKLCDFLEPGLGAERSPKVRELLSLFADLTAEGLPLKAAVFTRFRDVATKMAAVLQESGLPSAVVTRDTPADAREKAAADLADGQLNVLVICDEVLEGLDPVKAELAVHLDVPWSPVTLEARARATAEPTSSRPMLTLELVLAGSVEEHARRGLEAGREELAKLLPDISVEMEALPAQGDEPLQQVVEIMLDLDKLKTQVPEAPRPAGASAARAKAKSRAKKRPRPRRKTPKPSSAKPARSRIGPAGRGDVIVLSLATRRSRSEVTDPEDYRKLGLAVAVTYSFKNDAFTGWRHEHVNHLIRAITSASLVVGLEPIKFDYNVLAAYTGLNLAKVPTIEILSEVQQSAGLWVPAELLMQATLERRRQLVGEKSVELWRNGQIQELAEGIYEDVRLTRDLFLTALKNGKLQFRAGPSGELRPIFMDLKKTVPEGLSTMLEKRLKVLRK